MKNQYQIELVESSIQSSKKDNNMIKSALLSDCQKYRYSLTRIWDESLPKIMFIMLNPSTADGTQDDPTIRRCISFAKQYGYGGLYVCNIFAYRATNPKELLKIHNPFGDQNIFITRQLADEVETIVCAWGNKEIINKLLKGNEPYLLLQYCTNKLHYIDISKDGIPKHPLYLKSSLKIKKIAINCTNT